MDFVVVSCGDDNPFWQMWNHHSLLLRYFLRVISNQTKNRSSCLLHAEREHYSWTTSTWLKKGKYNIARIIGPSLIPTSQIIHTIIIHTIVCFPIDSIEFSVWIIHTFCLIRTKFPCVLCANYSGSTVLLLPNMCITYSYWWFTPSLITRQQEQGYHWSGCMFVTKTKCATEPLSKA